MILTEGDLMTEQEKTTIRENIAEIKERAALSARASGRDAEDIRIVLATKTQPAEKINFAAECGITEIGENRVQELLEKYDAIDREKLKIHFIGTLQSNKVKYIIDKVCLIHSVNSEKLALEISKQAKKHGICAEVLVEVNAVEENSKTGIALDGLYSLLSYISTLENIKVRGLMAIPPAPQNPKILQNTASEESPIVNKLQINDNSRHYFKKIRQIFLDISAKKMDNISMDILSLGMSADYSVAIEEGSNLIRPGRAVFGERQKTIPKETL